MPDKIDNVSIGKKANVFFDGKCVSHSVYFPDGSRKTVGVIMPGSQLTFNVGAPELMEITSRHLRSQDRGRSGIQDLCRGHELQSGREQQLRHPRQVDEVNYVCSFGSD